MTAGDLLQLFGLYLVLNAGGILLARGFFPPKRDNEHDD